MSLVLSGNTTFDVPGTATMTNPGAISGVGSLTRIGTGTLFLTVSNTCGGATTISGGTLKLPGAISLALTNPSLEADAGAANNYQYLTILQAGAAVAASNREPDASSRRQPRRWGMRPPHLASGMGCWIHYPGLRAVGVESAAAARIKNAHPCGAISV